MLQRRNFTTTGLDFSPGVFLGNLWVRSISWIYVVSPIDWLSTSTTRWLVFPLDSSSKPCNRRQFRREYCFCQSITESKLSNLLLRVLMFSFSSFISRSHLSCSYSWNLSLIKLTDSCRSVICVVLFIWFPVLIVLYPWECLFLFLNCANGWTEYWHN